MQDNVFEFWSGDYGLRLCVDQLDSFPIKNFRLCLLLFMSIHTDVDALRRMI